MEYLKGRISLAFLNINGKKDGYRDQENHIVQRIFRREKDTNYRTDILDSVVSTMNNFVRTVKG